MRERILDAAQTTFAAKGFAGTSIDAVAEAAGFTKGAVYSNFASKDDLFFALLDRQVAQRVTMVKQLVEDALEPTAETARRVGARLTDIIRDNADFQILFFEYWLRANRDPAVRERFAEHRRAIREQFAQQFDTQRHLLPDTFSAAEMAQLFLSLSNGIAVEEITEPGSTPPNLIGKVLAQLIEPGANDSTRTSPSR